MTDKTSIYDGAHQHHQGHLTDASITLSATSHQDRVDAARQQVRARYALAQNKPQPFWVNNRRLIISLALIIGTLSLVYALVGYVPQYQSHASVIIKDSALIERYVTNSDTRSTTSSLSANPVLNTLELLKSQDIAQALWTEFLVKYPAARQQMDVSTYREWELAYKNGGDFVRYHNVPGTDVITLSFQWPDAVLAKKGMQAVLNAFQRSSLKLNQSEYSNRHRYLAAQALEIENQLATIRAEISTFKETNNTYDTAKELENYSSDKIDFELELKKANAEANNYLAQRGALERSLGMSTNKAVQAVSLGRNETLNKVYEQYYATSQEYANLRARYKPEHPKMKQLQAKMDQAKVDMAMEIGGTAAQPTNPAYVSRITDDTRAKAVEQMLEADANYRGAQVKATILQRHFNTLEGKMRSLPQLEEQLAALKQQETTLSESLSNIQKQALEAKIRTTQTQSNVFVISRPTLPDKPQPPGKALIILGGLLAGLATGLAIANLKDRIMQSANGPLSAGPSPTQPVATSPQEPHNSPPGDSHTPIPIPRSRRTLRDEPSSTDQTWGPTTTVSPPQPTMPNRSDENASTPRKQSSLQSRLMQLPLNQPVSPQPQEPSPLTNRLQTTTEGYRKRSTTTPSSEMSSGKSSSASSGMFGQLKPQLKLEEAYSLRNRAVKTHGEISKPLLQDLLNDIEPKYQFRHTLRQKKHHDMPVKTP